MKWRERLHDSLFLFRVFCGGAVICCTGIGLLYWADASLPPSLRQELVAAAAVGAVLLGLLTALAAHIALLVLRIRQAGKQ